MSLEALLFNGTEYQFQCAGASEYKTADKNEWVFSLSLSDEGVTILQNIRITSLQETSVNGYTTYLVPFSVLSEYGAFTKITGTTYFLGYYTESAGTRTYTNHPDYISTASNYTGMAVCMSNSNGTLENLVFMYTMDVITKKTSYIELPGFSGYDTGEMVTFNATSQTYLWTCSVKVDTDKVYAIDLGDYTTIAPWAVKNGTSAFNVVSSAKFAKLGNYYIFPSIDGYLTWQMRPASDGNNTKLYNSDGIKIYVLDKPWEIVSLRRTMPCQGFIHAGNFKHQVLIAYALGWGGVETDVRMTSDNEYVLSHDPTIGGLEIATNTYADIKAAYPGILTVDELVEISAYFNCTIDFHFQAIPDNDRWEILLKGIRKNIDHLGYYTGITGNIGSVSADTFFENCLVYGYGDIQNIPSTIEAATRYVVGNVSDNVIAQHPQMAYYLPGTATQANYVITNDILHADFERYFDTISYLVRHYPIYEAPCKKISIKESSLTFTASGSKKLTPIVLPIYCSNSISWESSDTSVASVSVGAVNETLYPQATVTAVGNGTCTITATCGNMQASCEVTVSGM